MRYIANKYIDEAAKPAEPLPGARDVINWFKKVRCALTFAGLSVALYALVYLFNIDLTHIVQASHESNKTWSLLPAVIALVFTLVYGRFYSTGLACWYGGESKCQGKGCN